MGIIGLTDHQRPTHLGMIRIGEKKVSQGGKEYPSKLDYFIFDPKTEDQDQYDHILAKIAAVYGDKPKALRVKFASNNPSDVFDANYKLWQTSGLICKGNGETAKRLSDKYIALREGDRPKTGTDQEDIIHDEEFADDTYTCVVCRTPGLCPYAMARGQYGKPGCKASGLLSVVLPDIPGLGVWYLATGSINSIVQLNSAVLLLHGAFRGKLCGQEATLTLTPKQAIIPDTQKRTTVYVLNLTTEHSFNELAVIGQQTALPAPPEAALIYEGEHDDDDTGGEYVDPETGEVFDNQAAAIGVALEDDPEVLRALAATNFSPVKKQALINAAKEHGWTRDQFITSLGAQQPAQQQRPAQPAQRPQQQELNAPASPVTPTRRTTPAPAPAVPGRQPAVATNGGGRRRLF